MNALLNPSQGSTQGGEIPVPHTGRRGFSAISLVLSAAVMLVLMFLFLKGMPGMWGNSKEIQELNGTGKSIPMAAMDKAKGVQCESNLRQIRLALQMAMQEGARPPASLADLSHEGVAPEMLYCPVDKQPYSYDPSTGKVWCTAPGHDNF
jgi:hypothetical protein